MSSPGRAGRRGPSRRSTSGTCGSSAGAAARAAAAARPYRAAGRCWRARWRPAARAAGEARVIVLSREGAGVKVVARSAARVLALSGRADRRADRRSWSVRDEQRGADPRGDRRLQQWPVRAPGGVTRRLADEGVRAPMAERRVDPKCAPLRRIGAGRSPGAAQVGIKSEQAGEVRRGILNRRRLDADRAGQSRVQSAGQVGGVP